MDVDQPLPLLGGLSPARFMRRHWQRRPLLVRGALEGLPRGIDRRTLFALAGRDDVESRLILRGDRPQDWTLRRGPFPRRSLPALARSRWTLLVQGVDLHLASARAVLERFRFVPDARLDDLMVSYATDGGGVGPHFDSYDVFLIQAHGRRRWRWGPQRRLELVEGLPLKILRDFEPADEAVLEPGDMLYLPPRHAHDGVAEGECMTWSVGFRAPAREALAGELLQRLGQDLGEPADGPGQAVYRDPGQPAVAAPARVPDAMLAFARDALRRALAAPQGLERALGESLTEPKAHVWFDAAQRTARASGPLCLDARTRMLYDDRHVFINGESYRAAGRDAALMRELADSRCLAPDRLRQASGAARALLREWRDAGWLHGAV